MNMEGVSPFTWVTIAIGLYLFLLGCNLKLPPQKLQGKVSILILAIILLFLSVPSVAVKMMAPPIENLVLEEIKTQVRVPYQIHPGARIDDIFLEGKKVVYSITLNNETAETRAFTEQMKMDLAEQACQKKDFGAALDMGVSVEVRFKDPSGETLESIVITPEDCYARKNAPSPTPPSEQPAAP